MKTLREHLEAIEWECTHPKGKNALPSPYQVAQIIHHKRMAIDELNHSDEAYGNEKISPHPYWRLVWDADGITPNPESSA